MVSRIPPTPPGKPTSSSSPNNQQWSQLQWEQNALLAFINATGLNGNLKTLYNQVAASIKAQKDPNQATTLVNQLISQINDEGLTVAIPTFQLESDPTQQVLGSLEFLKSFLYDTAESGNPDLPWDTEESIYNGINSIYQDLSNGMPLSQVTANIKSSIDEINGAISGINIPYPPALLS